MKQKLFSVTRQAFTFPVLFFAGFVLIGLWRWWVTGRAFYLWNFPYIGGSIALGIFLNDSLTNIKSQIWEKSLIRKKGDISRPVFYLLLTGLEDIVRMGKREICCYY